ncbi:MAG: hexose kinase [Nitrospirae bacterium]|nr:hexose kinase [Nitrospirota bacterium]
MIVTVTLNPSQDKTLQVNGFKLNGIARADVLKVAAAGKGINVSRAVKRLNGSTLALTLLGGTVGGVIASLLKDEGIEFQYTPIAGESRTCLCLVDPLKKTETVINENGPCVTEREIMCFKAMYASAIGVKDVVAISGSAAKGIDKALFFELIEIAHSKGARTILDADGEFLTSAITALPGYLKINKQELEHYTGKSLRTRDKTIEEMKSLLDMGIGCVVITDGRHRVLAVSGNNAWMAVPPRIEPLSTLGCGDCVSGALAIGIQNDVPLEEALRAAVAAGTQNALSYGAGFIDAEGVRNLSALTAVKRIW